MDRRLSTAGPTSGRASLGGARARGAAAGDGGRMSIGKDGRRDSAFGLPPNENAGGNLQRKMSLDPRDLQTTGRRSSAFGARGSAAAGQPPLTYGGGIKDLRPIREKSYQLEVIRRLVEYLAKAGYSHPISQKILTAPSAKDFQQIFRFLYAQIDPAYDFGKKFEDEVPGAMRGIRYPFAGDISKSQLYAVGSMHAWPGLLAMLGWMVDLIEVSEHSLPEADTTSRDMVDGGASDDEAGEGADSSDHRTSEEVFCEFVSAAYRAYLDGNENFDELQNELAATFARRSESTLREAERLNKEVSSLEATLATLTADAGPLARARHEHGVYSGDVEKFSKFLTHLAAKKTKFEDAISAAREELARAEADLAAAEAERSSIQAQIDAQSVCPEDIDRMNAERDSLVRQLESLAAAKDEAQRLLYEREVAVQKRNDTVERLVAEFNYAGESLAIIPAEAANAHGTDLELRFNPSAAPRPELIIGADLRAAILPTLQRLQTECHAAIHEGQETAATAQEALERLHEASQEKHETVAAAERRLERLVATYLEDKEFAAKEASSHDAEAEKLEESIMRLRAEASSNGITSQQRLQRAAVEHDQVVAAIAADRERVGADIFGTCNFLLNSKMSMENAIANLTSEVDRQLAEL